MSNNEQHKKKIEELQDKLAAHEIGLEKPPAQKKKESGDKARQTLVERLIQEAMERGEFDNLPGKGKPLKFDDNPYLEPGQEWAFGLLKRNGFAPEWIECDKAIRREMTQIRRQLQLAWQQRQGNPADESKWQAAVTRFTERLTKLNRKIDDFNLIAPVASLQRSRLRLEDELEQAKQETT